uniref:Uncharacterized protein n=1 Tax=Octopus bimaculoides TaxID=37653 RepID=A0A0L8HYP9_OCTBM
MPKLEIFSIENSKFIYGEITSKVEEQYQTSLLLRFYHLNEPLIILIILYETDIKRHCINSNFKPRKVKENQYLH